MNARYFASFAAFAPSRKAVEYAGSRSKDFAP